MSSSDADENTPLLNNANGADPASAAPAAAGAGATAAGENAQSPNRTADAHVVSMTSDDDELLDDSSTGQDAAVSGTSREGRQWSFNPFDRLIQSSQATAGRDVEEGGNADSPYSPIGEEHSGASGSTWNRFLR